MLAMMDRKLRLEAYWRLEQWLLVTRIWEQELSGPLQLPQQAMTANLHVAIFHCTSQSLGEDMCLWNSESISTTDKHLTDTFLQQYMKTHIRVRPNGTYSLRFPWKENHPLYPPTFQYVPDEPGPWLID